MKRPRFSLGRRGSGGCPPAATRRRELGQGANAGLAHKLPRGDTRRSLRLSKIALTVAGALLLIAGCGESAGVSEGATVSVYVAAPLCAEAKRELAWDGGQAGGLRVRVICLPRAESSRTLNLATIGANARRATEDATTVGYIGEPSNAASRFSEPILEDAGIAQLSQTSGAAAMKKLLRAVDEAGGSGSLRASVLDKLE